MKRSLKNLVSLATAVAVTAISINLASATDLLEEEVQSTEVEFGTGWYIRGDIGTGIMNAEFESNIFSGSSEMGTPLTFGVAGGYQATDALRLEVGLNFFDDLGGTGRSGGNPCPTVPAVITGTCFTATDTDVSASNFMLNGYLDLKTGSGFTPYVGAGAGIAYLSWRDFTGTETCVGTVAGDCGGAGAGTTVLSSNTFVTDTSFTWAANIMAGISYDLTENAKLDIGYRYTYFGESQIADASANPGLTNSVSAGSTDVHEVRVGLRYEIW